MTNDQRSNDTVIPNLHPSAALMLQASLLAQTLPLACNPNALAPQYRPAVKLCVQVARRLYKAYVAMERRANWARMDMPPIDHYRRDDYRSPYASTTPGTNTGD